MTAIVGGLRKRLIRDSVFATVRGYLTNLGWFDAGRQHSPIIFVDEPQDLEVVIAPNTLALSTEVDRQNEIELGGMLTEFRWTMYLDFFAESEAISTHLIGDVADILAGRMPSIGAGAPVVPVYDFTGGDPTPPQLFTVQIESVETSKQHDWPHPWLKNWQSCSFEIVDAYGDETTPYFN